MRIIATLVLTVVAFGASRAVAEDCLSRYLQQNIINGIVECKTVSALRKLRATEAFRNEATEAIYRLRMYELVPTKGTEEALVQTIPRSDVTLSLLYHLSYGNAEIPSRPELFVQYLDTVYKAV